MPLLSVALTVRLIGVVSVGVHVHSPVSGSIDPGPEIISHVYGGTPPVAVNVNENSTPTTGVSEGHAVIVTSVSVAVSSQVMMSTSGGSLESDT